MHTSTDERSTRRLPSRVWSPSMVECYISCPRAWGLIYGALIPLSAPSFQMDGNSASSPEPHLRKGTLAHIGMQVAYERAREGRIRLVGATMAQYEQDALRAIDDHVPEFDLDEIGLGDVKDDVIRTLRALPAPLPHAVFGVERHAKVALPSGRTMQGVIDLALVVGSGALHVRDWKHTRYTRLPKPDALLDDGKMGFYAYALYQSAEVYAVSVGLYSLRDQREVFREMPYPAAARLMRRYDEVIDRAELDSVLPPTPRGGNCQPCPVRKLCPLWSKNTQSPGV